MKVTIDPDVKKIFFDRVTELHNGDSFDAIKWIESIAYGEKTIFTNNCAYDLEGQLKEYKKLSEFYKKLSIERSQMIMSLQNQLRDIKMKYKNVDEEVESYLREIQYYRNILIAEKRGHHIDDYDEDYEE